MIRNLLDEVRFELFKVIVLNAFLDATFIFLLAYLILTIFSIGWLIPLVIASLFFLGDVWFYSRRLSLRYIEERNPEVREMLRTAADNQDQQSLMAQSLFKEVAERMRQISSGSFLSVGKLATKLSAVFVLSIVLVGLAFFNVNIQKFESPLGTLQDRLAGFGSYFGDHNESTPIDEVGDEFGEPRMAELGESVLDITVQQSLNAVDFSNVNEAEETDDGGLRDFPAQVGAQAGAAYAGGLEEVTDRKTAADYSQEIK